MKIKFESTLEKYGEQGEKTGWTYVKIPAATAAKLKPGNKKAFRVKGKLDTHPIEFVSLIPIGGGDFIMAINATMRKAIRKVQGAKVMLELSLDERQQKMNQVFLDCLEDEPAAKAFFTSMPPSHQQYYSNWIDAAKTEQTQTKRIALAINTLAKKMNYGEMIRSQKADK